MELEELEPSKLIGPQQDVETVESWAERNGLSFDTARAWVYRGVIPTVKLGKRRMINSALLRRRPDSSHGRWREDRRHTCPLDGIRRDRQDGE